ncbi:hypothetical protein V8C37DRAFT_378517 [Trichoderma ceciliae]
MPEQAENGRARPLHRVLPAPARRSSSTASSPRHHMVTAACIACRKQKNKCSGERPTCHRCIQRQVDCHWTTQPGETTSQALKRGYHNLRQRTSVHEELFELLKNLSDQEAQYVFQRIRSGADITTILNHVKAGNLLLQMAVLPETRFRYEFPYRSEMPADYLANNPYMDSMIYGAASLYSANQIPNRSGHIASGLADDLGSDEYQSLYLKPFHAAQVIDPRLTNAKISSWTTVCSDDVLMRDLLGVFLRCEYHFTAAFQKDYFLDDMEAQHKDFCSSLLVNIILAYSCVCYPRFSNRSEYWNPDTLGYRFAAEAKRLWEIEAAEPRITTIQAGIVFNVFYNLCGLDEIGQVYRIHALALAHEIRLFDGPVVDEQSRDAQSDRIQKGKAFLAWALFDWETLVGFSFMFAPLLKEPPNWPLPDPSEDAQWYGEVWLKYPLTRSLSPSYFGQVFKTRSQFRVIMNEFCQAAYSEGSTIMLDRANELRLKLTSWYDGLPGPLLPKTIVLPGHLQLHIYYHHLILSIFEPLLQTKTTQEPSPQRIVSESKIHLQTLIRIYYLRHGFDAMDLFIVIPLMLAGSDCIDAINDEIPASQLETLRSTLILVAKGLYSQRRNHYLAEALFRVIRGRMRAREVALLRDTMNLDESEWDEKRTMAQAVRSHWPVSVVKKKEDLDSHILTNLVKSYAHLNIEEKADDSQSARGVHEG